MWFWNWGNTASQGEVQGGGRSEFHHWQYCILSSGSPTLFQWSLSHIFGWDLFEGFFINSYISHNESDFPMLALQSWAAEKLDAFPSIWVYNTQEASFQHHQGLSGKNCIMTLMFPLNINRASGITQTSCSHQYNYNHKKTIKSNWWFCAKKFK